MATGEDARFDVVEALDDRIYLSHHQRRAARADLRGRPAAPGARALARDRCPRATTCSSGRSTSTAAWRSVSCTTRRRALRLVDSRRPGPPRRGAAARAGRADRALRRARRWPSCSTGSPVSWRRPPSSTSSWAPSRRASSGARSRRPVDAAAFDVERVMVSLARRHAAAAVSRQPQGARRATARALPCSPATAASTSTCCPPGRRRRSPFLERGGTYALAILRGGGEYGESWHRAGMLGQQAERVRRLHRRRRPGSSREQVTTPDRLAISGGSNGGLLVGAALTQRPDLFRAVVCNVPLLDMLRYHLFRIAAALDPRVRLARRSGGGPLARAPTRPTSTCATA